MLTSETQGGAPGPVPSGAAFLMRGRYSELDRQLDRICACCARGAFFGALAELVAFEDQIATLTRLETSGLRLLGPASRSSSLNPVLSLIDQAAGALEGRDATAFDRAASDLRDALASHQRSMEPAWTELDRRRAGAAGEISASAGE